MTYSRPSTRPVSVGAARQRQQTQIIDSNRGVRAAPNARFIDASSVEIAGKNAARTDAEIKAFIDGLSPIVEEVGKSVIQERATNQLGELIQQDPDIGRKYLQGDPDTQARINSLNGYTKDLFIRSQQQSALSRYKEVLPSLALSDERLTGENALSDPEAYAAAKSEIQQKAMQMSGLSGLSAGALGGISTEIGQINGAVQGKTFAAQNTNQQRVNLTEIGDGQVRNTVDLAEGLESLKGPDTPPEETKRVVELAQNALEKDLKDSVSKGVTSPQRYLAIYLSRAQVQLDEYRARGEWEKADALLNTIELLAAGDLKLENGLKFWEQSIPAGKDRTTNVNQWLIQQRKGVNALQEQVAKQEGLEAALPLAARAAARDGTARLDFIALLPDLASDPAKLAAAMSFFNQAENFGNVLTVNDLDLIQRIADKDRDREGIQTEIINLVRSRQLPLGPALQLLNANNQGTPPGDRVTQSALTAATASAQSGSLDSAATDLTREQIKQRQANGLPVPQDQRDLYAANLGELKLKAFEETVKQQQAAIEAGKPMSQEEVNAAFVENINKEKNRRVEQLREGKFENYDVSSIVAGDLNEFEANIKAGKTGINQFPQRILDLARQRNIPLNRADSYKQLQGLMAGQMKMAIGPDGQPEFPNPGNELRQLQQRAQKEFRESQTNPMRRSGTPQEGGTNFPGGPNRSGTQSGGGGDQSSNVILDGLSRIAGVLAPGGSSSAKAGELPASVLNEDQTELLAKMWTQREAPTMKAPPLPQVDANAATQSVPVAISNDRHPFFIAIGIAEGTRTASGEYTRNYYGHTDQGDGNFNRGTVSGGRGNNMTPEQVDRQWMGVLTQQSLKFQGVLRALGLSPGTQGYNRTMFNALDLSVQAPAAVQGFLMNLQKVSRQGWSVEALAKARADAFYRYDGTLDAPGFSNNYQTLFRDQRSRAGVWDYRRRL